MKILVVGGSGFVGQNLVNDLAKSGHDLTVICRTKRSDSYYHINITKLKNVKMYYGADVTNYASIKNYFKNNDVVINLAGYISFKQKDKHSLMKINVKGSLNVLKACEEHNVNQLIHLSSTAALGFSNDIISEEYEFNWKNHKNCFYSYSKYLPNKRIKGSVCNTVIIYPPLILGPGDKTNTVVLIDAIKKNKIPFNLAGHNSYVDVRDLVSAIKIIINKKVKNQEFIISSGYYSIKKMNKVISEILKIKPIKLTLSKKNSVRLSKLILFIEKIFKDLPISYETVFISSQKRIHDSSNIKKLGWKSKYDLQKTIQDSLNWMKGDL